MRAPSAGRRVDTSSSSSRNVAPEAWTSRAPPASSRRTGGTLTVLTACAAGRSSRAELDVVDVLGDRGVLAADGAVGLALDANLEEVGRERVDVQEPADQRVADPDRQLDRLVRLQRPHDAG